MTAIEPGDRVVIPFQMSCGHCFMGTRSSSGSARPPKTTQVKDQGQADLVDDDPFGVDTFATHYLPLAEPAHAYEIFQKKEDGAVKIILHP